MKILVIINKDIDIFQHPLFETVKDYLLQDEHDVTVLTNVDDNPPAALKTQLGEEALLDALKASAINTITDIINQLKSHGITATPITTIGKEYLEIVKFSLAQNIGLVIKFHPANGSNYSPNELNLMKHCTCPIWLVGKPYQEKSKNIICAIDPDVEKESEADQLNQKVLDFAFKFATITRLPLKILAYWQFENESLLRHSPFLGVSENNISELMLKQNNKERGYLAELAKKFQISDSEIELIQGNVRQDLPMLVNSGECHTLIMGTVARTGLKGFLMGNTAETILRVVTASVITMKPDDFSATII